MILRTANSSACLDETRIVTVVALPPKDHTRVMTIMKKTKRMTTRITKSPRSSENPTNVDSEDRITDVKRTPSEV
jgi:hypothetical protein